MARAASVLFRSLSAISIVRDIIANISLVNHAIVIYLLQWRYLVREQAMARVPITIMGYRCERCSHEWIPRGDPDEEPRVCPKCRSPWWNKPRKSMMPYDDFKKKVADALNASDEPLTWTEVRTSAGLPQKFPNNQWVHRLEKDIDLYRQRDVHGVIHWQIGKGTSNATVKTADPKSSKKDRK